MRPAGEVRLALMNAARAMGRPATLRELAHEAGVAIGKARVTVPDMYRGGVLVIADHRRVDYRNRPVAVYTLAGQEGQILTPVISTNPLVEALAAWG